MFTLPNVAGLNQDYRMMKQQPARAALSLLSLLTSGLLSAQVPDGGIRLNAETGTTYQKIGRCTVTEGSVEGQEFTRAIRVQTGTDLTNTWDAQLKFPAVEGVVENDVVLVAFYARTISSEEETGEGFLNVIIEHNVSYDKTLNQPVSIGSEWKEYYAPAKIIFTLARSEASYLFHMGFPSQVVEVAEVRFLNYRDSLALEDLPVTEITYSGRAEDAAWREPAAERIGQIRKGVMELEVVDEAGMPLKGAEIHIGMTRHQFGFGTAVVASLTNSDQVYRAHLFDMFNEAVFENDLKWPRFEYSATHAAILRALDTLDTHRVPVRGHNIIWPSYGYMPDFVEELGNDPEAVRQAVDRHIDEVTTFTSGRLNDWDVINEPCTEHDVQDLLGDEVMADWFRRARRNDRGVKLYVNDFSIISTGGRNRIQQDQYDQIIRYIDSLGGGIDGIGMQGHMAGDLTSIGRVYDVIDRFAGLGKEIKITEHDINVTQREVQADYTRDFMTICFSHPAVKSILLWGFWAGAHWRPDAAFFDQDWNIRPHGEAWREMVKERWWTPDMDSVTDDQGKLSFEGFLGDYAYTVTYRDTATGGDSFRSGTFTMDHSRQSGLPNAVLISMDESIPGRAIITPGKRGFICRGESITLYAPQGEGLTYVWTLDGETLADQTSSIVTGEPGSYRVVISKSGISLTSDPCLLEVRDLPEAVIMAEGETSVCEGETVTFSANEGTDLEYEWYRDGTRVQWGGTTFETGLQGQYTLVTTREGCSAVSGPVEVTLLSPADPRCSTGLKLNSPASRLFPNPCHGSVRVELDDGAGADTMIELYDATGKRMLLQQVMPGTLQLALTIPGPGLYMLRIRRGGSVQHHKLVAE
jgi:endo-1,4-beta-xylanase